jgi:hypothetical protein
MRKVDYIFCLPGENYRDTFLHSWTMSVIELMKRSEDFIFVNYYSPIVSYTRNQLIRCIPGQKTSDEISLPFGGEIEAKKVIFIDDDIVWNPEDLIKIIKSKEDIVSGFYKMAITDEYNNNSKLAAIENKRLLNIGQIKNKKQLIELDSVGLGFIAINFEVFKKIQYPWFETFDFIDKKNNKIGFIGEDVSFCNKAKSAGYKIYGDPTVKVGHHKTKVLDFKNE